MRKKILSILGILCMILAFMPMISTTASAQDNVTYLYPVYNTNGGERQAKWGIEKWENGSCDSYTPVTASNNATIWSAGWYVVESKEVEIKGKITCSGNVNLILKDDCTLTASAGITVNSNCSLTIYGQTKGTGGLNATGSSDGAGIQSVNENDSQNQMITINGGKVTATGNGGGAGIGGGAGDYGKGTSININGGKVTDTGGGGGGAGIGSGYSWSSSSSSNIWISATQVVKAGSSENPTDEKKPIHY